MCLVGYRCDQYRWRQKGTFRSPEWLVRKDYFQAKTVENPTGDPRFCRSEYQLLDNADGYVLSVYEGDQKVAKDMPYGNAKNSSRPFIPNSKLVKNKIVDAYRATGAEPKKIYDKLCGKRHCYDNFAIPTETLYLCSTRSRAWS